MRKLANEEWLFSTSLWKDAALKHRLGITRPIIVYLEGQVSRNDVEVFIQTEIQISFSILYS